MTKLELTYDGNHSFLSWFHFLENEETRHICIYSTSFVKKSPHENRYSLGPFQPIFIYFFLSVNRKAKRKDTREGEDERQYLLDEVARQRITDADLDRMCDIPHDMDHNEWLATHSMKSSTPIITKRNPLY